MLKKGSDYYPIDIPSTPQLFMSQSKLSRKSVQVWHLVRKQNLRKSWKVWTTGLANTSNSISQVFSPSYLDSYPLLSMASNSSYLKGMANPSSEREERKAGIDGMPIALTVPRDLIRSISEA